MTPVFLYKPEPGNNIMFALKQACEKFMRLQKTSDDPVIQSLRIHFLQTPSGNAAYVEFPSEAEAVEFKLKYL